MAEVDADAAKVTVIVPVKQPVPFLDDAMRSIIEQTSPRWRMVVVIERRERAAMHAALASWRDDDRITVIENSGRRLAGAINTAMRAAVTPFVALLLGDDLWHTEAVETLEWYIAAYPDADFFHSGRRIVDDHGEPLSSAHPAPSRITMADFASGTPVKHLLCWRREMALAAGGLDERSRSVGPDDLDFPWTMAEHGAVFCAIDECLYVYRDHRSGERLTTHIPLSVHERDLRRIFRKHGLDRATAERRLADARATYLRQCLYRTRRERWLRTVLRRPPKGVWRDTYR